jgi:hypothetical protein
MPNKVESKFKEVTGIDPKKIQPRPSEPQMRREIERISSGKDITDLELINRKLKKGTPTVIYTGHALDDGKYYELKRQNGDAQEYVVIYENDCHGANPVESAINNDKLFWSP